jgi:hypothetical protein
MIETGSLPVVETRYRPEGVEVSRVLVDKKIGLPQKAGLPSSIPGLYWGGSVISG